MEETTITTPEVTSTPAAPATAPSAPSNRDRNQRGRGRGGAPGGRPRRNDRPERKSEFDQKIIMIRRVARVMAGGRRFNFSVAVVIGNKKGKVGVGLGKAGDTSLAIDKAVRDGKKHMIEVARTKENSIRHDVNAKYAASVVALQPAPRRGLVAGGSVRTVLELAGITNVTAKIHSRSKNHLNNARCALKALEELKA